jgi:hypothetical protein
MAQKKCLGTLKKCHFSHFLWMNKEGTNRRDKKEGGQRGKKITS